MVIDLLEELTKIANDLETICGEPKTEEESHWILYPLYYEEIELSKDIYVYVFIEELEGENIIVIQAQAGKMSSKIILLDLLSDAYYHIFSRFVAITDPIDTYTKIFVQASLPLNFWQIDLFKKMLEEVAINADYCSYKFV